MRGDGGEVENGGVFGRFSMVVLDLFKRFSLVVHGFLTFF